MSQLSELGHAQNEDEKGKLQGNGFSVSIAPTQSESLRDDNHPTTTTTTAHG